MPEANSAAATAIRARFKPPIVLTPLHRLELVAAWNLKAFRQEIPIHAAVQAAVYLQEDIDAGIWTPPGFDLAVVFTTAEQLASRHSAETGTRTLDILHVAAALELAARTFITGDARQAKLAEIVGLRVIRL